MSAFTYFVRVDLVTSPKITALLLRFIFCGSQCIYVIVDGEVNKMEQINASQVKAQAVRLA